MQNVMSEIKNIERSDLEKLKERNQKLEIENAYLKGRVESLEFMLNDERHQISQKITKMEGMADELYEHVPFLEYVSTVSNKLFKFLPWNIKRALPDHPLERAEPLYLEEEPPMFVGVITSL